MRYPVFVQDLGDETYEVIVPDLAPHCSTFGDSMDSALEKSKETIELYIEGLLIDEETIPAPTQIEILKSYPQYSDGIWAIVSVDISSLSGKAKRVNVTLPERLLTQVDRFASARGETRSGFLAQAALKYMAKNR